MRWKTVPATMEHAAYVAANMRAADIAEIEATARDPVDVMCDAMAQTLENGVAKAIVSGDRCAAVFGVLGISEEFGAIWMLGTDDIAGPASRYFLRISRPEVEAFNRRWPVLGNLIDKRNTVHIRWLEWTGFEFGEEVPAGPKAIPFLPFTRRQDHVRPRNDCDRRQRGA